MMKMRRILVGTAAEVNKYFIFILHRACPSGGNGGGGGVQRSTKEEQTATVLLDLTRLSEWLYY